MGKRLKTQRRGAGSPIYTATINAVAVAKYISYGKPGIKALGGEIVELIHDPSKSGVLAKVVYDDGSEEHSIAAEGTHVGQRIMHGKDAPLEIGNVKMLGNCAEGCPVFNVEKFAGDGGSLVRSSGAYALIMSRDKNYVYVKMPSGKIVGLSPENRATIGCAGGGGRKDKPYVKAGKRWHAMRAKHKKYPYPRGVAMNALNHPFGGANHHPGKSKSTSRHAAPGRKVGDIASSRTGRRKKS